MAHQIRENDNLVFTGSRTRIWHGLGDPIPEGLSTVEAFEAGGLMFPTELAPIQAVLADGTIVQLKDNLAHIRTDVNGELGVVSKGYAEINNRDFAEFCDMLAGSDMAPSVSTAGSLYNGRRIYCSLKLPKVIRIGDDTVENYLVVSNGHGGFASFSAYPTSVRPICDNTLRWSERDLGKGIRFRHEGDVKDKIGQARVALGLATKEVERFEQQVKALANCDLSAGQLADFMDLTYDRTFGDPMKGDSKEVKDKLLAKKAELVEKWLANMEDERQLVAGIQGTAWAALNAVTQWHDHERGRFKSVAESGARLHSNLFGTSNRDKGKALRTALELV